MKSARLLERNRRRFWTGRAKVLELRSDRLCKMIDPSLLPRVVQRNELLVDGIARLGLDVLVIVAALASQCQVIQRRRAAFVARYHVLD